MREQNLTGNFHVESEKGSEAVKASQLWPIVLIVFIDVLGFTVVIPLLPLYAERYGARPATVGALLAIYAVGSLIAAPLLGRWSDRIGRKPVLLLSQAGSCASFVMLALAPSLAWLFAARLLDGLTAGNVATARAYLADTTPREQRARAFGLIAAAFGFGYLIGPATAGLLARYGAAVPLWAAAGLSAASGLCTLWLLPSAAPTPLRADAASTVPPRLSGDTRELRLRLMQLFGFLLAFSCFTGGFALYCERRLRWGGAAYGAQEVGLVLAYVGLLGLVTQLVFLRHWVARAGESGLVRQAFVIAAAGYAGLSLVHELPWLLVCLAASAVANSALRPSLLALISFEVAPQRQGAINGLTQALQSLAMMVGPLLAGALIDAGWLSGWALACAALLFAALALERRVAQRRASVRSS
ncbi:MAG TPA: MFS transporter [Dehalococcoidia bacterium]|nr:MFS transporter [Dehalococcoidia bacterium]